MPRKSKVAQSLRSTRGLGYLPVILLVASALIVGAGHEPLQHWLGSFFQADSNVGAVTSNDGNVSVSETRDLDSPQQIESLVASEIDLTILKVTVADSTRIECSGPIKLDTKMRNPREGFGSIPPRIPPASCSQERCESASADRLHR